MVIQAGRWTPVWYIEKLRKTSQKQKRKKKGPEYFRLGFVLYSTRSARSLECVFAPQFAPQAKWLEERSQQRTKVSGLKIYLSLSSSVIITARISVNHRIYPHQNDLYQKLLSTTLLRRWSSQSPATGIGFPQGFPVFRYYIQCDLYSFSWVYPWFVVWTWVKIHLYWYYPQPRKHVHSKLKLFVTGPSGNLHYYMRFNRSYSQRSSVESDALWDSLFPEKKGFVQHPELAPNVASIAVFHELHCLVSIEFSKIAYGWAANEKRFYRISSEQLSLPRWTDCLSRWEQKPRKWTTAPAILTSVIVSSIYGSHWYALRIPILRKWIIPHMESPDGRLNEHVGTLSCWNHGLMIGVSRGRTHYTIGTLKDPIWVMIAILCNLNINVALSLLWNVLLQGPLVLV